MLGDQRSLQVMSTVCDNTYFFQLWHALVNFACYIWQMAIKANFWRILMGKEKSRIEENCHNKFWTSKEEREIAPSDWRSNTNWGGKRVAIALLVPASKPNCKIFLLIASGFARRGDGIWHFFLVISNLFLQSWEEIELVSTLSAFVSGNIINYTRGIDRFGNWN